MINLVSKLPRVGTTIFTEMSALANQYGAVNLSQGFPNFEVSSQLIGSVEKHMRAGYNQYAPMGGLPLLQEQIAHKIAQLYNVQLNATQEISITAGGTQALYTAITATIKEGDEVIVFEPAYDSYVPAIQLNGGRPVFVPLTAPDYKIPWDAVKKVVNNRTRMIILNNPHNPTGTILDKEDIAQLQRLVEFSDMLILSDEVYEHIVFDRQPHESILKYPDLLARSFVVFSFGKTFHATGWKIGYCVAPPRLTKEFRKVHQFVVFSVNTPMQYALADYIQNEANYLNLNVFYQQKRDYFLQLMQGSCFHFLPSYGSYYVLASYKEISNSPDREFVRWLTTEAGVAAIPISVFYNNGLDERVIRFCFAKTDDMLEKAAHLLCKI